MIVIRLRPRLGERTIHLSYKYGVPQHVVQRSSAQLPPELSRYTILSEWDRAELEARRRQRALDEFMKAKTRSKA